jgi:hypothetical protein
MDRRRQSCENILSLRLGPLGQFGFHDVIIRKGKEKAQDSIMRLANSQRKQGKI